MSEIVYLNGKFIPKQKAVISPDDRGFIFADGIYEVIKYYNGKGFRFEDHLQRLKRSVKEIGLKFSAFESLEEICSALVDKNNRQNSHAGIYIQITRGAHQRVHFFPSVEPTIYAFAFELPSYREKLDDGIKAVILEDIRWLRCDIKSVSLLPNTMLFNEAVEKDAGEAILIRDGNVTEATHSSVLCVKNGTVVAPPLSRLVLPGITRKVVLEICGKNSIPFEERVFSEKELCEMDEVFIAGTGSEITPVVQIDDLPVGNKKPGEITRFIQQKFFELV